MKTEKKTNNLNNIFAIIVIVLSLVSIFINISKVPEIREKLSGYASYYGYVNITINTQINLNITNPYVNFSSGTVTAGATNATLITNGSSLASVTNGNWSTSAKALTIANIGNINCSLNISGTRTAATFFGGSTGDQLYQWNVSNKELGSCSAWNETSMKEKFANVNLTSTGAVVCNQLGYNVARNEMWIDFKLAVPYDATVNISAAQYDTITISADAAV